MFLKVRRVPPTVKEQLHDLANKIKLAYDGIKLGPYNTPVFINDKKYLCTKPFDKILADETAESAYRYALVLQNRRIIIASATDNRFSSYTAQWDKEVMRVGISVEDYISYRQRSILL